MTFFSFCALVFCVLDSYNAAVYRQERAVIKYYNPKYISQAQAFTARRGRSESYTTNVTFTNLHVWNNNVTFRITYLIMKPDIDFSWSTLLCDKLKHNWLSEYIKLYSDIPRSCPLKSGQHNFFNMIFPPKNFPFPMPQGETNMDVSVYVTKTLEKLADFSMRIRLP